MAALIIITLLAAGGFYLVPHQMILLDGPNNIGDNRPIGSIQMKPGPVRSDEIRPVELY